MESGRRIWRLGMWLCGAMGLIAMVAMGLAGPSKAASKPSEYQIGVLYPLTGPAAITVEDATNAIRVGEQFYNARGGIGGVPIKLIWFDTQANTELGARGMAKLASVDRVPAVMSIYTNVAFGAYPIAEERKVFLVAGSQAPTMAKLGLWCAKVMPLYNKQMDVVLPYAAKEMGVKTVVGLYENLEYGIAMDEYLRKKAPQFGIKVLGSLSYEMGVPDLKPQLTRVKGMKPDAIFFEGAGREGGLLLRNARETGFGIHILSNSDIEPAARKIPDLAEGLVWAQPYVDPKLPLAAEFRGFIREKLNVPEASHFHAFGWKTLSMTVDAIKYLQDKGWEYTGENVRKAFLEKRAFETIYGKTKLEDDLQVTEPMALYVWEKGKPKFLKLAAPGS